MLFKCAELLCKNYVNRFCHHPLVQDLWSQQIRNDIHCENFAQGSVIRTSICAWNYSILKWGFILAYCRILLFEELRIDDMCLKQTCRKRCACIRLGQINRYGMLWQRFFFLNPPFQYPCTVKSFLTRFNFYFTLVPLKYCGAINSHVTHLNSINTSLNSWNEGEMPEPNLSGFWFHGIASLETSIIALDGPAQQCLKTVICPMSLLCISYSSCWPNSKEMFGSRQSPLDPTFWKSTTSVGRKRTGITFLV